MIKLKRLSDKPILEPVTEHEWERKAVFNCSAIYDNGLFHLIYRATDIGPHVKYGKYISRLGYAVSKDGINFMRLDKPVLSNDVEQELRGCEDPRIVKIDDTYYMMYTGFGDRTDDDYRICLATSKNLINWERKGVVLDEPNKDAALFPEKINGNYVMFHRRYPDIWLAYSNDLKNWFNHKSIIKPIKGTWESSRVGVAGPPIRTKYGWFLIYHAADDDNVYRLGAALLDINDPSIVLARQKEPILEPELEWEKNGFISNVVFSCGNAVRGDDIFVYYGGADTVIGVAYINMNDIKFE
ncbi:MAG: beta,2-mannobiose phosphorylase / 1,2-beta-oligomannan phosphorylase [Thermoanaerobacterium sp.]|nr:beta,2-mannobiose phosphorylase / 1,2-beta-oligomannan phosphorylase [Thermoanaerobacterium sp.]